VTSRRESRYESRYIERRWCNGREKVVWWIAVEGNTGKSERIRESHREKLREKQRIERENSERSAQRNGKKK